MVYLDNSATTRVCPSAIAAMVQASTEDFGNPSSLHAPGAAAARGLAAARETVAAALGCAADELIFTSGGTEGNNLAILGAAARMRRGVIVTDAAEHKSVLEPVTRQRHDLRHVLLPLCGGAPDLDALRRELTPEVGLISMMLINNETGARFPVERVRELCLGAGVSPLIHCDAVAAFGRVRFSPAALGADMVTISAHKIHGPKGCGALYVRRGARVAPLFFGGGQEGGMRPGTENAPAIMGFAAAVREHFAQFDARAAKVDRLCAALLGGVADRLPTAVATRAPGAAGHIVSLSFPGLRAQVILNMLSARGIHVGAGSACGGSRGDSHVLKAMGLAPELLRGTIRVSLTHENSEGDIAALLDALQSGLPALLQE